MNIILRLHIELESAKHQEQTKTPSISDPQLTT